MTCHVTGHAMCSDSDEYVRKNVATLIREIVRHTPEVCMACMITKQSKIMLAQGSIFQRTINHLKWALNPR